MSHRPRESLAFRGNQPNARVSSSQQSSQGPPNTTRKPRQEDNFNYGGGGNNNNNGGGGDDILLRDDEIVQCVTTMGIDFSLSDLQKPSPTTIQMVFEHLVSEIMGIRRETVDPLIRAVTSGERPNQQDDQQEQTSVEQYPDAFRDTLTLLTFYRHLTRLMHVCSVNDFSLTDLLRPEYKRIKVHLSQIINFSRFRVDADRSKLIAGQAGRPEEARERLQHAEHENQQLVNEINRIERQLAHDEPAIKAATAGNEALTEDLRTMRKKQEVLLHNFDKERTDRKAMAAAMENQQYLLNKTRAECDKIRPYIVDSPATLHQIIADMTASLHAQRVLAEHLDRTQRALVTSTESFAIITSDLKGCISLMEECEAGLVRLEEVSRKVARNEEVLKGRENDTRESERSEALLRRQLASLKERIDKGRKAGEAKREAAQRNMEELRVVYEDLARERGEKEKEMERKKMRIEQIEKKMADLREAIEAEVQGAHIEMAKMKAHIEAYIREMEQKINSAG
ncbi:Nuf2 family-domain-containing protein [Peziza echinospora]|nr:Nuf2 family-domain-containing protein [Peziza echinospora]